MAMQRSIAATTSQCHALPCGASQCEARHCKAEIETEKIKGQRLLPLY